MLLPSFEEFLDLYKEVRKQIREETLPEMHIIQANFDPSDSNAISTLIETIYHEAVRESFEASARLLDAYHSWLRVQIEQPLSPNNEEPEQHSD